MTRYLAGSFIEGALHRGKSVEQFLGAGVGETGPTIRWIEIRPVRQALEVWFFEAPDIGSREFLDIYEFNGDAGPEEPLRKFNLCSEALQFAEEHFGASALRWVNEGVVQSEYEDFILADRPTRWPPED